MHYTYLKMRFKKTGFCCALLVFAITAVFFSQAKSFSASIEAQAKELREKGYTAQLSADIDSAAMFYQKAIEIDSSFAEAYNDLGVIFEMRTDLNSAETNYLKALELDNSYLPAYSNLAYLYEKKGDFTKAAIFWKKRIENSSPDDEWAFKAKDNLKRLSKESAEVKEMLLQDEAAQFKEQVSQKKLEEFKQRIALTKEHFDKGEALFDKKEFASALEELRLAKKLSPDDKKIDEAINKATQKLIDSKINLYANKGLQLFQEGDYSAAKAEFKKLLAIIPASSNQKSK